MLAKFKPTWMIESIYDITPQDLQKQGIKVVLTDLDNTLIAWNNPDGTPELRKWLKEMEQAKIPVVVISNNNHKRVKRAVESLSLPFISRALKPFSRGVRIAKRRYHLQAKDVVLVGDQLMTDIAAANSAGIRSVLVRPIVQTDAWNTKFNRFLEKQVKKQLAKKEGFEIKWRKSLDDRK
ncbi:YqeG family HAD IIIA-type phosphatase [Ligilactobacillus ceti]|uniref:Hydrolase, haloacid dehalogenase-like family n=1 Tax=Ligilactobacillus ceti DSM 22408 TaxID=1122146 RepID=A0A0R2KQW6_9LACO|nr:YqeG family HAD IIIA-type phosphatase [Ligilactobacillus ceti]KRN88532.1 hydrolase, haloacid dehalogenase-like family [Ligilactobacillus ceti DSM 22408]